MYYKKVVALRISDGVVIYAFPPGSPAGLRSRFTYYRAKVLVLVFEKARKSEKAYHLRKS